MKTTNPDKKEIARIMTGIIYQLRWRRQRAFFSREPNAANACRVSRVFRDARRRNHTLQADLSCIGVSDRIYGSRRYQKRMIGCTFRTACLQTEVTNIFGPAKCARSADGC